MDVHHSPSNVYTGPRRNDPRLVGTAIGRVDLSRYPLSMITQGLLGPANMVQETMILQSSLLAGRNICAFGSKGMLTINLLKIRWSLAASIVNVVLYFRIIQLGIIIEVCNAVGIGWYFVRLILHYSFPLDVWYTFGSPYCLIRFVLHFCLAFPPTLGETCQQISHVFYHLQFEVVDFKGSDRLFLH